MSNKLLEFFPLAIDNTMFSTYKTCPLKFYRQYVQHLNGAENVDLVAGKAFAAGIEVTKKAFYNDGLSIGECVSNGIQAMLDSYGDFDYGDSPKSPDQISAAIGDYFIQYPLGADPAEPILLSDGTRAIEYSFAVELPIAHPAFPDINLVFVGRADSLVSYVDKIWVADEKTTKNFTRHWATSWDMRSQFTGYCWGIQESLPEVEIAGALIRGVAVQKTQIKHQEALSTRSQWDMMVWKQNFLQTVQAMVDNYKKVQETRPKHGGQVFPMSLSDGCMSYMRPCSFADSCRSANGDKMLASYQQNIWLPDRHERMDLREYLLEVAPDYLEEQENG